MRGKSEQTRDKRRRRDASAERLLARVNLNAAGIDIGAKQHWVAVPEGRSTQPVQPFEAHTSDLYRLANWLSVCGVDTVAMESTGVYWIPLYEILEARGFQVVLANAHHAKNVPGRKTDVLDCQWLQRLHTYGLLLGSFRPPAEITALRTLVRHREGLVQEGAAYTQRMQKALVLMNIQLPTVLSDITGKTGMAIIRDIVAGQTDPAALAGHRDERCKATSEQLVAALTGHYRPEQVFLLRQTLALFDHLQVTIAECDQEIERSLAVLQAQCDPPGTPLPARRLSPPRRNEPRFDLRSPLYQTCGGTDLTTIPGIGPLNALKIIAEIGTDMSPWPTDKHFTAWLGLAPRNKISGGRRLSARTLPSANRATQALRLAAMANTRGDNALAAHYRRLALRIGTPKALTAAARKLAIIIYHMLKDGQPYRDISAQTYSHQQHQRHLRRLMKQAKELGYQIVPIHAPPNVPTPVS